MKKIWEIFLLSMMLFSCAKNDKKTLYDKQLKSLLDNTYVLSSDKLFDVTITIKESNEKYVIELLFYNPQIVMKDVTIMLLDNRVSEAKDAPLNVGFFTDSLNFVSKKENNNDQTKIRFTFYSDLANPSYECALSYIDSNTRIESYYIIDVK